jgi:hypothetical protein
MRTCKNCKDKFEPQYNSVQSVCSFECSIELTKKNSEKKRKKEWNKEKKKRKEALKTNSDWLRDTQKIVNKYIRERDKDNPFCISCGKVINGVRHASHFMSSGGHSNIRFNTDNIWVSCYKCNVMLSGNQLPYRVRLIEKIGLERVEYIESIANEVRRYSIDELKEIQKEFKEKVRLLNK